VVSETCPVCSRLRFSVVVSYSEIDTVQDGKQCKKLGKPYPYFQVVCDECGFTLNYGFGSKRKENV